MLHKFPQSSGAVRVDAVVPSWGSVAPVGCLTVSSRCMDMCHTCHISFNVDTQCRACNFGNMAPSSKGSRHKGEPPLLAMERAGLKRFLGPLWPLYVQVRYMREDVDEELAEDGRQG